MLWKGRACLVMMAALIVLAGPVTVCATTFIPVTPLIPFNPNGTFTFSQDTYQVAEEGGLFHHVTLTVNRAGTSGTVTVHA